MDTPHSGYSAVYGTPNPNQIFCPQCAGMEGPGGFTALPELASALPQYNQLQQPTGGMMQGNMPSQNRPYPPGYMPSNGMGSQGTASTRPTPSTGSTIPQGDRQLTVAINDLNQPMPMTVESLQYLNGFMRTQIGRRVTVEFLIGTNTLVDRTGILLGVGANYILINETDTDDLVACDYYNIKFVKFYY